MPARTVQMRWKPAGGRMALAANANGAEAEDHVATRCWAAKAHHRTETREEQHLIELVAQVETLRPGQNLVRDHLAVLVHCNI